MLSDEGRPYAETSAEDTDEEEESQSMCMRELPGEISNRFAVYGKY